MNHDDPILEAHVEAAPQGNQNPGLQEGPQQGDEVMEENQEDGQMEGENLLPEFLYPIHGQLNNGHQDNGDINLQVNMALTDRGSSTWADPGWAELAASAEGVKKTNPDVLRLWAKQFSPASRPQQVVNIPNDWAPFFTMMLLSPNHFYWAKTFLASQAWEFLLSCAKNSASLSFAIPTQCPQKLELVCQQQNETEDNPFREQTDSSDPMQKKE